MNDKIIIKGARHHNLKNIDVEIPKNKFVVITGLSGSGKSTLAFDTIYAEGQRRYVESLSAYARQFLGLMEKPDVDSIEGLSPAISIEQKSTSKNPRSTVGTVTEIYDYLRLLFARLGTPKCPIHHIPIEKSSPTKVTKDIIKKYWGKEIEIFSPIIRDKKGTYETLVTDLYKDGYMQVVIDGKRLNTDEKFELDRYKKHNINLLIDTIFVEETESDRIQEAIETSFNKSEGLVEIIETQSKENEMFSEKMSCPKCGYIYEELQPRMFSFNTPQGACEDCHGLGFKLEIDPDLVIPDKSKALIDGAVQVYGRMDNTWRIQQLNAVGKNFGFDVFTPIKNMTQEQLNILLYGSEKPIEGYWNSGASMHFENGWEGVIPQTMRLFHQTESDYRRKEIAKFMREQPCNKCGGRRLNERSLNVFINDKNIIELTDLSVDDLINFFDNFELKESEKEISYPILRETKSRLEFLKNVGLGYLTLSRSAGTLSGGESQRIRLATQLGSKLTGVLYVLDEPSIGLHQRDNSKLIDTLHDLRDLGNTLIVVEHDEETIEKADYVIDIGPRAGVHGGKVVAIGTPQEIKDNKESITGQYLSKEKKIEYRKKRREPTGFIKIKGARQNNLKNIDVEIPKNVMTFVTGVSGSGKSTLIHDILYKGLMKKLYDSRLNVGNHDSIENIDDIEKVIIIDQSPIGKTPRSNPATYTKLFDEMRVLFSKTTESKFRGYSPGRFSFNVKGGRCEKCKGDGQIKIEMNFLPDVYVECDECHGKRYNRETLEVKYKGKSIADVLDSTVDEAVEIFSNIPSIYNKLKLLKDVGLGYIKLGQSSTTLSGGESQRIKLTRELSKKSTKKTLYILDEPTTGLHFEDINQLLKVLNKLVDIGSSMIIIEHNLDMIKNADYIIDLGPEGGQGGGKIIAKGTPEEIIKNENSWTAKYLKDYLK
ncbi:MAG: excinuclease ABC subunit UvrA [Candidatus Nanoarchaeia archaeon]|nr:excinuclease ABC subunit UvrA [Candidatus Nanoarchaeia archaeon]